MAHKTDGHLSSRIQRNQNPKLNGTMTTTTRNSDYNKNMKNPTGDENDEGTPRLQIALLRVIS